jgi:uncharacterized damage-inducible protein DinB
MKNLLRLAFALSTVVSCLTLAAPALAQQPQGVVGDLLKDISGVEEKVMALAKAMPDSAYAWRPGPGVRSTGEVFQHVAADNYFMPALMGKTTPKEIGITKEYKTAEAWEKKKMDRAAVMTELTKSFEFLKSSLTSTTAAQLDAPLDVFGQKSTTRGLWISTATHLHEHLGQLIAYARTNKVTPPWSK